MKKFLCALMALSLILGLAVTVTAADTVEVPEDQSYCLYFPAVDWETDVFLWASQHSLGHIVGDEEREDESVIFNLLDGNGESVPAYCTDVFTGAVYGTYYRRIDLEDSSYHIAGTTEKLRSIVMRCFPFMDLEQIAALANAAGYPVTDLTIPEAMNAAQTSIWETTHGEEYEVTDFCADFRDWSSYVDIITHPETMYSEATEHTATNIANLYAYYMSLEGTAPQYDVISEYSLEALRSTKKDNGDGTFTVDVYVTVNADIQEGDDLTITFAMGDQIHQQAVTAAGEISFRFDPVAQVKDVDVIISGTQTGCDVYLYEAVGGRDVSQSMIGYGDMALPVYGKRTVRPADIDLQKDVVTLGNKAASFDVGQAQTWIIRTEIPEEMAEVRYFALSDTLDHRLNYLGDVTVTVGDDTAALVEGTDYVLTVSQVTGGGVQSDRVEVVLTADGIQKAADSMGELRVRFDTAISQRAIVGLDIPNFADVHYISNMDVECRVELQEEIPYVTTGGLKICKVDREDPTVKLAGATFRLARLAAEGEGYETLADGTKVVYVDFYATDDLSGEKVSQVTTDENGVALFCGLAYGEYYLVEIEAPEDYELPEAPVVVTVDATSHLDEGAATVTNEAIEEIPITGDVSIVLLCGLILVVSAMAVLVVTKRRTY